MGAGTADLVDAYFEAFNGKDFERLSAVFSDDVRFVHHNRGLEASGREELIGLLEHLAREVFTDRRYVDVHHRHEAGDRVVVESTYETNVAQDLPGIARAGDHLRLDLCSVFTVRDGRIARWDDYG